MRRGFYGLLFLFSLSASISSMGGTATSTASSSNLLATTILETVGDSLSIACRVNQEVSKLGEADGSASVQITGGVAPFMVTLTSDTSATVTVPNRLINFSNLSVGLYEVWVVDANDCNLRCSFTIRELLVCNFRIDTTELKLTCPNKSDGRIGIELVDGQAPFSIEWSHTLNNNQRLTDLAVGTYEVIAYDFMGCSDTATFEIVEANELFEADTTYLQASTCQPAEVGIFSETVVNAAGCSGLIITEVSLLRSDSIFLVETTCFPQDTGLTTFNFTNEVGCDSVVQIRALLGTEEPLSLSIGNREKILQLGDSISFVPESNFTIAEYQWTGKAAKICLDCPRIDVRPLQGGTYGLIAFDENGCSVSAEVVVKLNKEVPVFIPNVFSPNGDNLNDELQIFTTQVVRQINSLQVFDRGGRLVYEIKNQSFPFEKIVWDGTFNGGQLPNGVLLVVMEVELFDGAIQQFQQSLTLVR
ncbi:MAG: gliding motility-associated C-terminal domain-containing protein [Bacteroidota bacterium]